MSDWEFVATPEDLPPGSWMVVDIDDVQIAVFNVAGEFYAVEDECTHDHACLTGLPLEGHEVVCPRHGARFDLRTGEALSAPAYEPLTTFPTRVDDGRIEVRDDRWD